MNIPFRIKVCGVRTEADVRWVGDSAADAIGLNFHPDSIRAVESDAATNLSELAAALGLRRVGVFVHHSPAEIVRLVATLGLDAIQLHGDQDTDFARVVRRSIRCPIMRAVKLPTMPMNEASIDAAVMRWVDLNCAVLLDADCGPQHGGGGKCLDWDSIAHWRANRNIPFALAGGITPENVAAAIRQSGADAVDAASGTERTRGVKDPDRIGGLAAAADSALGHAATGA